MGTNHMHVYKVVHTHTYNTKHTFTHSTEVYTSLYISHVLLLSVYQHRQSLLCVTRNVPSHTLSLSTPTHTHSGPAVRDACKRTSRELLQTCLPQRAVGHSGRQLVDKHLRLHQAHSLVLLRHLERAIITHFGVTGC